MQLRDITLGSLKRRPTRGAFVVAVLAPGVGPLVALVSLTRAIQSEIGDELDRFGANIVVTTLGASPSMRRSSRSKTPR